MLCLVSFIRKTIKTRWSVLRQRLFVAGIQPLFVVQKFHMGSIRISGGCCFVRGTLEAEYTGESRRGMIATRVIVSSVFWILSRKSLLSRNEAPAAVGLPAILYRGL
jgi:hypothetical protein